MRQIVEMRRDKDTYHVVLGDVEPDSERGVTAAIPVTSAMKGMSEKDRLTVVLEKANEQADEALKKAKEEIDLKDGVVEDEVITPKPPKVPHTPDPTLVAPVPPPAERRGFFSRGRRVP